MSKTIDQRVVEMRFDNTNFEKNVSKSMSTIGKLKKSLKFEDSTKGFENISKAAGQVDMGSLGNGVESVKLKFSALEVMAVTALSNITNKAIDTGAQLVKSLTVDQIAEGWDKFKSKTSSVATLVAQGYDLSEVNEQLNRLNWFTDETSYNFTEMTSNIAKFTATGKGLTESVSAMEGIANWAALSGQNAETASRAMYQLSQAMGAGVMRKEDYKSIQNASMDTEEFRQKCLDAGVALGTLKQNADGTYKSLVANVKDGNFTISQFAEHLTQDAWLTSDVMMQVFGDYSSAVDQIYEYAEEKGITASQAIEELGDSVDAFGLKAFKAAQEARSWSDAVDSVKDAVSTGWMQTFELIFGNQKEATELWTDLANSMWDVFASGGEVRNELLSGWKELGGRDALLECFWNSWNAFFGDGEEVLGLLGTIKEAFSEIFPPMTSERLVQITEKFRDLTEKFKMSEETAANLKNTFKGFFAILDIGKQALSAVFKAISPLFGGLGKANGKILELTGSLGEWLVNLDATIKKNDTFTKGIQKVSDFVEKAVSSISEFGKKALTSISDFGKRFKEAFNIPDLPVIKENLQEFLATVKEKFATPGLDALHSILERIKDIAVKVKDVVVDLWNTVTSALAKSHILETLGSIWTALTKIAHGIGSGIGTVISTFINALADADFSKAVDTLNGLSFGGILIGIKKFISKASDALGSISSIKDSIVGILDGVKGCLESWQKDIQAGTLLKITSSIGILAISLTLIAGIDSEKLMGALTAISALFVDLVGSMAILDKTSSKGSLKAAGTMIGLALAISILAGALKKLGDLNDEQLKTGIIGITGLMVEVVAAAKILSSGSKKAIKGMFQMVLIAVAMKIFASACEDLSKFTWDQLLHALAGIGGILLEFVGFQALMKLVHPEKMLTSALSLILIGAAFEILANVCSKFANKEWGDLAKAGAAIAGILAISAGFMLLSGMAKKMVRTSFALILIGASLEIFADIAEKFGKMKWENLAKAGAAIAGILAISAGFMLLSGMATHLIGSVMALTLIAASMEIFAHVCTKFAEMEWSGLAKAGAAIGGILLLVSGFALLSGLAPGIIASSAALLVMSVSLAILTPVLKSLGGMSWGEIAKGLVAIAGAFAIIGVAGLVLGPIIPAILGLAAALALIGVAALGIGAGLTLAGIGLTALAAGFSAIAAAGAAAATAFVGAISIVLLGIADLLPSLVQKFGETIKAVCDVIIQNGPAIGEAIKTIVLTAIDVVIECVPQIVECILTLVEALLVALVDHIPTIVSSIFDFLITILNTVAERLPELISAGVKVIMAFFQGIVDALNGIDTEVLVQGIVGVGLLSALMIALAAVALLVPAAMLGVVGMGAVIAELSLVLAAIGGLSKIPGLSELIESGGAFLETIGTAIGSFIGGIAGGILTGISDKFPAIGTDLSTFMTNLQPFIEGARKLDPTILDSVNTLVDTIMTLTKAELLSSVTSWLTGGSSIADFGAQLALFGPQFAIFAASVKGIDPSSVEASANAFKTFAEAAGEIPNEGGVVSWFTGDNTLEKFGTQLALFGPQFAIFAASVKGIDPSSVEASANAFKTFAEAAGEIPNEGGVVSWFTGDNTLEKFGAQLALFGPQLAIFANSVAGIDTSGVQPACDALKLIAETADELPNEGGFIASIIGDNTLTNFARALPDLGDALLAYGQSVSGISKMYSDISSSVSSMKKIAELADSVSSTTNAGKDLKKLGDNMIEFAKKIKSFVNECANIDATNIADLETALSSIVDIAKNFSQIDTSALEKFTTSMESIGGTSVDKFLKSFSNSKTEASNSVKTLVENLTTAIDNKKDTIQSKFSDIAKHAAKGLTDKKSEFKTAGNDLMTEVGRGVDSQNKTVPSKFVTILTSCIGTIRGYYTQFQSAGSYLVTGFANGITANSSSAASAASNMASKAASAAKKKLQINSPSKVGYRIGNFFGTGFTNGIDANAECAARSGENLAESAQSNLTAAIAKILAILDGELDTTPTIRPVLDLSEIQNGAAAMSDLMNSLSGTPVEGTVSVARRTANCMSRRPFADENIVSETSGTHNESTTNNFYITGADPNAIADAVDRKLQFKAGRRKATWA